MWAGIVSQSSFLAFFRVGFAAGSCLPARRVQLCRSIEVPADRAVLEALRASSGMKHRDRSFSIPTMYVSWQAVWERSAAILYNCNSIGKSPIILAPRRRHRLASGSRRHVCP